MTDDVDPDRAVDFLVRNFSYVSVMSFDRGACLHPHETGPEAAREFIEAHADKDIYAVIAKPNDPLRPGKPRKEDMAGSDLVWADLDPPPGMEADAVALERWRTDKLAELDRSGLPQPNLIENSGRGLWAIWRLSRTVDAQEAEAINRGIAQKLQGDSCHNIDRVTRVPFTKNSKTGAIAGILREVDGEIAPEALPHADPASAHVRSVAAEVKVGTPLRSLGDLDEWKVDMRLRRIIEHGRDPDDPKEGDDSRSAWVWECVLGLVRHGVPDETVLAILLDRNWAISESVYDNGRGPEAYARRQLQRAREHLSDFIRDDKGRIVRNNQHNIRLALAKMDVSLSYDSFAKKSLIKGLAGFGHLLDDAAGRRLWFDIAEQFGFQPTREFFWEAILDLAAKAAFHPVRDYLESLNWDGVARLETWLVRCAGASDTAYVRAVSAIWLLAAVRRVRQPGVKFDEMLVLESKQGTGKSTALSILAVNAAWFSDECPFNAEGREVIEAISGKWIVEAGELAGLRKSSEEKRKSFLSRAIDHGRAAYGRIPQSVPRECVFVGTTNDAAYLSDGTGNRRYLPVRVDRFDVDALTRDRDQLWAEAAARESAGESIRLPEDLWASAAQEQEARRVEDPIVSVLENALAGRTGRIRSKDVWLLLDVPLAQRSMIARPLGKAMQELGWMRGKFRFGDTHPEWGYEHGSEAERRQRLTVTAVSKQVIPESSSRKECAQ